MLRKPWEQWTERDWNSALFRHYFQAGECDAPVTRLVITGRELTQVAGCEWGQAEEAERRFVAVIRRSPGKFNAYFRPGFFTWPPFTEPPAIVLFLLFSCYVASGNEQVISERDFRRRLAAVLDHPPGTVYPLDGLAKLWESFRDWLLRSRATGCGYRELILPEPDWMTRIGYSLRLTFPQRRDRVVLRNLMSGAGLTTQPPLLELIKLLGRNRDRFTPEFVKAFQEFQRLFRSGDPNIDHLPIVDAVREAIELALQDAAAHDTHPELLLIGESDEQNRVNLMLLSNRGEFPIASRGLLAFESEHGVGHHQFVLAFKTPDNDGADTAIELFLAGDLADFLPNFNATPLWHIARDGVVLLHRGTSGMMECALNLDVEGELRVLMRRDLLHSFDQALPKNVKESLRHGASAYDDWHEFVGIPAAVLRSVDWIKYPMFADVRCLQRPAFASRITLVGGIATGEPRTFLGYPVKLPAVRAHCGISTVSILGESDPERHLVADADGLYWITALDTGAPLDGEFMIKARNDKHGDYVAYKRVHFRTSVDRHDYLIPTHPQRWLCESSGVDMRFWDPNDLMAGVPTAMPTVYRPTKVTAPPELRVYSEDIVALTEILAASAVRRCGFTEGEMIELFGTVLGISQLTLIRLVLRSWVEAGHLDVTVNISWRVRRYFARAPRLILRSEGATLCARLVGLSPSVLINRLRARSEMLGGTVEQCLTWSPWINAPWEIRGLDLEQLQAISNCLGLNEPVWSPSTSALLSSIQKIKPYLTEEPLNYTLDSAWCWANLHFSKPSQMEATPVRIERWCRATRLDRPDYYVVRHESSPLFVSYSRNWTLLTAARLACISPYQPEKGRGLASAGVPWASLPTSIGRFSFAAGQGAGGPILDANGRLTYVYPMDDEFAVRVLRSLGLSSSPPWEAPPWLDRLATARAHVEPKVAVRIGGSRARYLPLSVAPLFMAHARNARRSDT